MDQFVTGVSEVCPSPFTPIGLYDRIRVPKNKKKDLNRVSHFFTFSQ